MNVLLDENFLLLLVQTLRANAVPADEHHHPGLASVSITSFANEYEARNLLFMTHDTEFLMADTEPFAVVVVSRVTQARKVAERIATCHRAVRDLIDRPRA